MKTPKAARVILVDADAGARRGLRAVLDALPEFEVVAEGATAQDAFDLCELWKVEVLVLDVELPDMTGAEACHRLKSAHPSLAVILLTSRLDGPTVPIARADGHLLKSEGNDAIARVLRTVVGRASPDGPRVSGDVRGPAFDGSGSRTEDPRLAMTGRERRVVELIARGLPVREVADRLGVPQSTVWHVLSSRMRRFMR